MTCSSNNKEGGVATPQQGAKGSSGSNDSSSSSRANSAVLSKKNIPNCRGSGEKFSTGTRSRSAEVVRGDKGAVRAGSQEKQLDYNSSADSDSLSTAFHNSPANQRRWVQSCVPG